MIDHDASTVRQRPQKAATAMLAGILPYDLAFSALHALRSLQVRVWSEVADRHMARVADAFTRYSGMAEGTIEFSTWRAAYLRHTWTFMPAHLSAIALTGAPPDLTTRVDKVGWSNAAEAFPPGSVVALSRTGLSIAIPWLLAASELPTSLVAEPSGESEALRRAYDARPAVGRNLMIIDGDAKALFKSRRALRAGLRVVLYPEFGTQRQRLARVAFLRSSRMAPLGSALLSWLCRAPIIPACAYSTGARRIVVEVGRTLDPTTYASVDALNDALFSILDGWVGEHLDQWVGWEYMCQLADDEEGP